MYKINHSDFSLPSSETEVLKQWKDWNVFQNSVDKPHDGEFVFYDGPPFANGLPHYGHLLTSYVKDTTARFQTMLGKKVERRFGWDCHGLPAEMETEKELSVHGSHAIRNYGIDKFNNACKDSVLKYANEWKQYIDRAGRWVDFDSSYQTMDLSYMESVIWGFNKLYQKGLIYEDHRVMPYSWKCETPLSNFETRLDNSYRKKTSKTATIKFTLTDGRHLIVWTTTPWTLPANLAIAVNSHFTYLELKSQQDTIIIEKTRYNNHYKTLLPSHSVHKEVQGSELVNQTYTPLFPFFINNKNSFKILHADFVNTEEGTGIVHIAPGFGEDDQALCKLQDTPLACPIDSAGRYTEEIYDIDLSLQPIPFRKSIKKIETERLFGVPFQPNLHREHLESLFRDPEVVKYYPRQIYSYEDIEHELDIMKQGYEKSGLIRFTWFDRETNDFVAIAGLDRVHPDFDEVQFGIMISKNHWNKGIAREILKEALPQLARNTTSAYCTEDNIKMIHILEKFNFSPRGGKISRRHGLPRKWLTYRTDTLSLEGRQVLDCNDDIIHFLKQKGLLVHSDQYTHNYPHCWRTDTPLIYKAVPSWYVNVRAIKDRIVELNAGTLKFENINLGDLTLAAVTKSDHEVFESLLRDLKEFTLNGAKNLKKIDNILSTLTAIGPCPSSASSNTEEFKFWLPRPSEHSVSTQWAIKNSENNTIGFIGLHPQKIHTDHADPDNPTETSVTFLAQKQALQGQEKILIQKALEIAKTLGLPEVQVHVSSRLFPQEILEELGLVKQKIQLHEVVSRGADYVHFKQPHTHTHNTKQNASNSGINWIPEHVKHGLFGKWAQNARDWSITRNRFWGCPVPIWKSTNHENKKIYSFGSVKEIENFFKDHWKKTRSDVKVQQLNPSTEEVLLNSDYVSVDTSRGEILGILNTDILKLKHSPYIEILTESPSILSVRDLHRPFIDKLTAPDPDSESCTLRRVEDVLDCWFESGSMPFASVHYPFENKDWFEGHFPGDFVVEYMAQTRGWFYTMIVMSVALFDTIPFKNCICHGIVLDSQGQKLSKRLKNYPDPLEVFKTQGSDSMRWFLLSSNVSSGGDLSIGKDGKEIVDVSRLVIKPIWNAYNFFAMYANADNSHGEISYSSANQMDKYITLKTYQLTRKVSEALKQYDFSEACSEIEGFIETLNNWYIRRNKDRFWKFQHDQDKQDAYNTLYTTLRNLCQIIAPLLPFTSEAIYSNLTSSN